VTGQAAVAGIAEASSRIVVLPQGGDWFAGLSGPSI
jgi:hypothetical protein